MSEPIQMWAIVDSESFIYAHSIREQKADVEYMAQLYFGKGDVTVRPVLVMIDEAKEELEAAK